jgi:peptidoglycan/xylan/chitin deacetylase (PgdA/CDA1 family)
MPSTPERLIGSLRRRLTGAFFDVIGDAGLRVFFAPSYAGMGVVLMFHRVIPDGTPNLYPGYAISVTELDRCLAYVHRSGWRAIHISDLPAALTTGSQSSRFVVFSFDDGYRDNLTLALPLFRRYRMPLCVYVATGLVNRTMFYWWGAIERLILERDEVTVELPGAWQARTFETRTIAQKVVAYQSIDGWYHAHEHLAEPPIRTLLARYGVDPAEVLDSHALTIPEMKTLSDDPLVTIGSHGVTHRRMALLSDPELRLEMMDSRAKLQEWTGREVVHLAYPFGGRDACSTREFEIARQAGYVTAVTTRRGNIFREHGAALHSLPRRVAMPSISQLRNSLHGVTAVLRREPRIVVS